MSLLLQDSSLVPSPVRFTPPSSSALMPLYGIVEGSESRTSECDQGKLSIEGSNTPYNDTPQKMNPAIRISINDDDLGNQLPRVSPKAHPRTSALMTILGGRHLTLNQLHTVEEVSSTTQSQGLEDMLLHFGQSSRHNRLLNQYSSLATSTRSNYFRESPAQLQDVQLSHKTQKILLELKSTTLAEGSC